ncbi:MAG: sigma-70 family RNA polymerase sigma factor [Nocardioidaceae bacterium]|nr:sigma-70 family RNA polymerase sigma factor [Nocardioidaceae bacterium]
MRGDLVAETDLLAAARDGDSDAYAALVAPHRAGLHAHCYRMLGSTPDAEDALQEALLRAWRGLDRFAERSSLRTWLYRIATNACLTLIERRPARVLPVDFGPAGDPHGELDVPLVEAGWLGPYPDGTLAGHEPGARFEQREAVELAFVAALQHLPARQRAVLIMREVLGFSGAEVAEALEMSPEAVYSALQRAHRTVDERLPEQSQQAALRAVDDERLRTLVNRYVEAWERADVGALVDLLTEDAVITMPPYRTWYAGRDDVLAFLAKTPLRGKRWKVLPCTANGHLAFAHYLVDDDTGAYVWHSVELVTLRDDRVCEIVAFIDPESYRLFGLPAVLTEDRSAG